MLDKSNTLVIVPAFNEQATVGAVLSGLHRLEYQVLVISDGSVDETAEIARKTGAHVLELPINLGVGGALRAGFKYACRHGFEAAVQVDADGQHPPEEIGDLIATANSTGAHMVIGSRFLTNTRLLEVTGVRRIAMRVLSRSATSATNSPITDSTSGFRIIKQPLLEQFSLHFANNYLGDTYEAVIAAGRAGYQVIEIPAGLLPRASGESTASTSSATRFTLKGLGVAFLRLHKRLAPVR